MTYSVQALSQIAGVSPRTLRYYDQIGLLPAQRNPTNGYREYPETAVDQLQVIRYFQTFGFQLTAIQDLMAQPKAAQTAALAEQRQRLAAERDHLTTLLNTLDRTLAARNGGPQMTNSEKFSAFKHEQLAQNDRQFGPEVRQRYGAESFAASQQKFANLSEADYQQMQATEQALFQALHTVTRSGDLASEAAQQVFTLHRQWLCFTWNNYTVEAHRGLAQMYAADSRFADYYNDHVGLPDAAQTLVAVITRYAK